MNKNPRCPYDETFMKYEYDIDTFVCQVCGIEFPN